MELETIILFALVCKHALADLGMQSFRPIAQKQFYFNKGLHLHSFDHGAFTFVVLLFFLNPITAFLLALLDYICHWHIDFIKSNVVKKLGIEKTGNTFWRIQTIDQILHYSTYMLIVFLI